MAKTRAPLDEARLNALLLRNQETLQEIKTREEAFATEDRRLALLDAVLAERKILLDQREAALARQEEEFAAKMQREEAELQKHAAILMKLKEAIEAEERRMRKQADKLAGAKQAPADETLAIQQGPVSPLAHLPRMAMQAAAKARGAEQPAPGCNLVVTSDLEPGAAKSPAHSLAEKPSPASPRISMLPPLGKLPPLGSSLR